MASEIKIVEEISANISSAGAVVLRKLFGEYAIYCDAKLVALVCENQLYVKPTKSGRAFLGSPVAKPPYAGAKDYFWISDDQWGDRTWLSSLIHLSAAELPLPVKRSRTSKVG